MNRRVLWLVLIALSACSRAPAVKVSEKTVGPFKQVILPEIRVRRPEGIRPDPKVGPGGRDYQASVNDKNWDCETLDGLLSRLRTPLSKMYVCYQEIQQKTAELMGQELRYQLVRQAQPLWRLLPIEQDSAFPKCVSQDLKEIPLPRELFFLNPKSQGSMNLECFASSLDLEKNRWMGIEVPSSSFQLVVTMPLSDRVESRRDFEQVLKAWILTPFFVKLNDGSRALRARPVPLNYCQSCFGEKDLKLDRSLPVPVWP